MQISPIPNACILENMFVVKIKLFADILVELTRFLHVHILVLSGGDELVVWDH